MVKSMALASLYIQIRIKVSLKDISIVAGNMVLVVTLKFQEKQELADKLSLLFGKEIIDKRNSMRINGPQL
jgi:hypothetical protein